MPYFVFTVTETTVKKYRVLAETPEEAKLTFDFMSDDDKEQNDYDCLNYEVSEVKDEASNKVYDYAALEYPPDEPFDGFTPTTTCRHCGQRIADAGDCWVDESGGDGCYDEKVHEPET